MDFILSDEQIKTWCGYLPEEVKQRKDLNAELHVLDEPEELYRQVADLMAEELIAQLLTELPEPDREIFFRRYYYRESCREIGRRLNMQEHTVNVRLSRGREKLRKQFAALRNTY